MQYETILRTKGYKSISLANTESVFYILNVMAVFHLLQMYYKS